MKLPKLGKANRRFSCQQDPQTKAIHCESYKEFEDGTRTSLAEADFQFDADCKPVPTNLVEHEEGELIKLEKKALPLLKTKCKGTKPGDY
jgi:hypothetical protein